MLRRARIYTVSINLSRAVCLSVPLCLYSELMFDEPHPNPPRTPRCKCSQPSGRLQRNRRNRNAIRNPFNWMYKSIFIITVVTAGRVELRRGCQWWRCSAPHGHSKDKPGSFAHRRSVVHMSLFSNLFAGADGDFNEQALVLAPSESRAMIENRQ